MFLYFTLAWSLTVVEKTTFMLFGTHSVVASQSKQNWFWSNKRQPVATLTCDLQDLNPSWGKIRYRFWRHGLQVFQIVFIPVCQINWNVRLIHKIGLDKQSFKIMWKYLGYTVMTIAVKIVGYFLTFAAMYYWFRNLVENKLIAYLLSAYWISYGVMPSISQLTEKIDTQDRRGHLKALNFGQCCCQILVF